MTAQLTVGLVGPGRSRNGLGPYVAGFLEEAGLRVVAGVGRHGERCREACEALGRRLGHDVGAYVDVREMLDRERPDVLAIHAPVEAHLPALRAAHERGVDVLCDKPLVTAAECGEVADLLDEMRAARRVVLETCQWPEMLVAHERLWPQARPHAPAEIVLGLSPSGQGPAMVEDSLSHLLSLVQSCARDAEPELVAVRCEPIAPQARRARVEIDLRTGNLSLCARLELNHVAAQPRPAWLEIDGRRMERWIDTGGGGYAMGFARPDGKRVGIDDPLRSLVYRLPALIDDRDGDATRHEFERIRGRARLYAAVLDGSAGCWREG